MQTFDFLAKAQKLCEDDCVGDMFHHHFTRYREKYSIKDSIWFALAHIYSDEDADQFFDKHWG